jgi:transcription-repair coupling factor (superfamily II helicase)
LTLCHITNIVRDAPAVASLRSLLDQRLPAIAEGAPSPLRPAIVAATTADRPGPTLVIVPREDRADESAMALKEWLPPRVALHRWPAADALPYEQLPIDRWNASRRIALLDTLDNWDTDGSFVLVTSASALGQRVIPPRELRQHVRLITRGQQVKLDELVNWLMDRGYEPVPLVQEPGTFAKRGGILDLFTPGTDQPVRIDFFGDEIDSLRSFDPSTQRSNDHLQQLRLLPPADVPFWRISDLDSALSSLDTRRLRPEVAAEWERQLEMSRQRTLTPLIRVLTGFLIPDPATLLDHLPEQSLIVTDEPSAIERAVTQVEEQSAELAATFVANGELPPGLPYPATPWTDIARGLSAGHRLAFGSSASGGTSRTVSFEGLAAPPTFLGRLAHLSADLKTRLDDGWRVVVATDQADRITEILEDDDLYPRRIARTRDGSPPPLPPGTLEVRSSDLDGGWSLESERLLVLSDYELFGFRKEIRRGSRRGSHADLTLASSLQPGEYVVHVDHGIGRFAGLVRLEHGGVEREYMLLEYARGDKLYVPVDQGDRVTRYGAGGVPSVTRLGSGEWVRVKRRARRAIRELAFELIQLYAAREASDGQSVGPDTTWDHELAASFPYTETPDQQAAIEAVKRDMESARPMDRLVCGDVGFGKTEVALRAAFKAVNAGRQVAVLVPTTVLALQHFTTFSQRLAAFPVRVEMLSRLRPQNEQRSVLKDLAIGNVDIVIGTHRLVQRDVALANLGLVIVDEEQRFGVRQKEFLKRLRTAVDVLTMTATPIPRTLHMALAGVRDISVIETAPQDRLPIRTFVTEYNEHIVREVVLREIDRGGQVYIVHNRVHDIDRFAQRLRTLVPEARFGIGHGQMEESVLEEVILGFVRHEYDVLVSTTIIESGIDIPNVNTIVIDDADKLGLTQLHQLRGRVGRGINRAYAYLLHRPAKALTEEAQERLDAIQEATELGAGLRVATRDLEIRGAGNMLGGEQSGHIEAIGFELYMRLLQQAVKEIQQGRPIEEAGPITLDLPLTALIPASYVVDTELRLNLYRRIAAVTNARELSEIQLELIDRFGPLPDEVERLVALIALRLRCQELGIDSIVEREREIVIRPIATDRMDRRLLNSRLGHAVRLTPQSVRIKLQELEIPWQEALDTVLGQVEVVETSGDLAANPGATA